MQEQVAQPNSPIPQGHQDSRQLRGKTFNLN